MEDKASFDRFFGDGRTLGYGLFLAGLEISGQPDRPLKVRYVEPRSDAATRGVLRGDEVVSANGRTARDIVAADDFGVFTPADEGQVLDLVLRRDGATRNVSLRASVYDLTPVSLARVVPSPQGRRMGYLHVKDMISQAEPALDAAFDSFRSAGVQDLVIDLRYNGGGLVSLANKLASYVTGSRHAGDTFVQLLFNDQRARLDNTSYRLENPRHGLALSRVYVLAGQRTCSASELVVNGLRPYVDVVMVGDTTCGKPVGFVPQERCGTVFSVVNFESVNARDQGRYFDGIQPTCDVADDLSHPLGDSSEALLAEARQHADSGRCSAPVSTAATRRALQGADTRRSGEPRERQGMLAR
jgi:C-terminal processing protease CtpA/Prc